MKKSLFSTSNIIISIYILFLFFTWRFKYYGPISTLPSFLEFLNPFIVPLFLLLIMAWLFSFLFAVMVSLTNIVIKGKKRFIPLLINLVMLYGLFFIPFGSWYLQKEHASLRLDREAVVTWADMQTQNQNDNNTIVTLELPEKYKYLSITGNIRVFNKDQLLIIEFPYQTFTAEPEDDPEDFTYTTIYYVSSDDYKDVLNYFGRYSKSHDIVKYWYIID